MSRNALHTAIAGIALLCGSLGPALADAPQEILRHIESGQFGAVTHVEVLIGLDIVLSRLTPGDGIAHLAHVGGAAFGYLFFRLQALSRRSPHPPPRAVERVVMVQTGASEPERRTPAAPIRPRRRSDADPVAAEVDRVLDKISEQGIGSLTAAERRFLDEGSRQKKQGH